MVKFNDYQDVCVHDSTFSCDDDKHLKCDICFKIIGYLDWRRNESWVEDIIQERKGYSI